MDKKDLEAISQIVHSPIEGLNNVLREEMNVFEEKILDRMFLFEQEYGKKIDAIFDVAVMQKDKVQEMYKNQENLEFKLTI